MPHLQRNKNPGHAGKINNRVDSRLGSWHPGGFFGEAMKRELERKIDRIFASMRTRLTDFQMLSRDEKLFNICEDIKQGLNDLEGKVRGDVRNENHKEM